jgi:hypothetical protein
MLVLNLSGKLMLPYEPDIQCSRNLFEPNPSIYHMGFSLMCHRKLLGHLVLRSTFCKLYDLGISVIGEHLQRFFEGQYLLQQTIIM